MTVAAAEKCISVILVNVTCIMSVQNISAIMCGKQLCQISHTPDCTATGVRSPISNVLGKDSIEDLLRRLRTPEYDVHVTSHRERFL